MSGQSLVWLIGASSGIGAALAGHLVSAGYRVAISARRAERLNALRVGISGTAENCGVFPVDVTDEAALKACAQLIETKMGAIDIAIINAGDYRPMPLAEFDVGLFRRLMDVNYLGVVNSLAALLPVMLTRGAGQILVTASIAGYRGLPLAAPYSASKAAAINLAEALQPELRKQGIRIRVINPGFVDTPLTKKNSFRMPFLITPETAASRIVKHLEHDHFEIAFPRRFAWSMKLLRCLPYRLYFPLVSRMTNV